MIELDDTYVHGHLPSVSCDSRTMINTQILNKTLNAKAMSSPLSEVVFEPSFWPMPTSTPFPEGEGGQVNTRKKLIDKQSNSIHQWAGA